MAKYRLPRPKECPQCNGTCYAYAFTTRTGNIYKFYWACNSCKNTFETVESEKIFVTVDKLPEDYNQYMGIVYQTITDYPF